MNSPYLLLKYISPVSLVFHTVESVRLPQLMSVPFPKLIYNILMSLTTRPLKFLHEALKTFLAVVLYNIEFGVIRANFKVK